MNHLDLHNGRQLSYDIRYSTKARSLRIKLTARDGLSVIAPKGLDEQQVAGMVTGKREWILAKLKQFDEVRHLLGEQKAVRPESFNLPALAETWCVEYKTTKRKTVGACADRQGRVLVYGAVDDIERCKAALRRWLARHAKETLTPWLDAMAVENDIHFDRVIIKNQRTRWGSCSAEGVISLNAKLLFLSPKLVRYVLMHELFHNLEHNHTIRFWAHLRQWEPESDLLHSQMRDAWKQVPAWAHPVQANREGV